jgi:lysophospholipase L1-like esterase
MTRLKRLARLVLVNLAVLAVALGVIEIVLRITDSIELPWESSRVDAVRIPYRQTLPGVRPEITFTSNDFGFRTLSMTSRKKPQGKRRVLCLGASTTMSSTQNTDEIWCSLLELKLKSAGVASVETAARGAGGLRVNGLLNWSIANVPKFEPDVVILLMGANDMTFSGGIDRLSKPAGNRERCVRFLRICRLAFTGIDAAREHFAGPQRKLEWGSENLPRVRAQYAAYPYVAEPVRNPDPIDAFSAGMERLVSFLRDSGIEVIVLGQPALWRADLTPDELATLWFPIDIKSGYVRADMAWMAGELRRYNARQEEIARRLGVRYVDLDRVLPKDLEHYTDDFHYTDRGNEVVAQAVLPALMKALARTPD